MRTFQGIRDWLERGFHLLPRTVCAALLLLGADCCQAQPPAAAEARTVEGKVQRLTTAPKGEIDGALLNDGTSLHWPPHLQDRFTKVVVEGQRVRATGRTERTPGGEVQFEVDTVTNTQSSVSASNPDFAAGPPGPPPGPHGRGRRGPPPPPPLGPGRPAAVDRGELENVQGNVTRLTTALRGEIDGAVLDSGKQLHWPPHLQDRFTAAIKVGDPVRATGRTETGPAGDTKFEVQSVTNTRTDQTVNNPDPAVGGPSRPDALRRDMPRDLERRLQDLERQIEQLQHELDRLRSEK